MRVKMNQMEKSHKEAMEQQQVKKASCTLTVCHSHGSFLSLTLLRFGFDLVKVLQLNGKDALAGKCLHSFCMNYAYCNISQVRIASIFSVRFFCACRTWGPVVDQFGVGIRAHFHSVNQKRKFLLNVWPCSYVRQFAVMLPCCVKKQERCPPGNIWSLLVLQKNMASPEQYS